ncbi:MAG TPA: phenylalanine--tRNA ligase beta subunit-related protein [Aggregatilineales bacterium]|nr:hypothetical protein [Anaerolineales bacterium]HRE46284.1 phenylalanine--tRNA ligase beta subunit-related protein [Aggregatilineales bacterium]
MTYFRYHSSIVAQNPTLVGGLIIVKGANNQQTPPEFNTYYAAEQATVRTRIGTTPLSELPTLAAWRAAFRRFGADPTRYRCAAESLLRRLTKQGDIPSLSLLVDIGNLISIRYALPVAVMATERVTLPITVKHAVGTERYTPLGEASLEHPEVGEVIFTDETECVLARRWCWRQGEESAARPETTHLVIAVEAHHAEGRRDCAAAVADMAALIERYAGGRVQAAILDAAGQEV